MGRLKPQRRRLEVERLTASLREDALFLDLAALLREEASVLLRDAEEREREATERDLVATREAGLAERPRAAMAEGTGVRAVSMAA